MADELLKTQPRLFPKNRSGCERQLRIGIELSA